MQNTGRLYKSVWPGQKNANEMLLCFSTLYDIWNALFCQKKTNILSLYGGSYWYIFRVREVLGSNFRPKIGNS